MPGQSVSEFVLIEIIGWYHQDEGAASVKYPKASYGTLETGQNVAGKVAAETMSNIRYQPGLKTAKRFPKVRIT